MCWIIPEESKKNFIINIKQHGGKVIGEYINSITKVECVCPKDHICFPTPNNIQRGQGMCNLCNLNENESCGEKLTAKVLDAMGINYTRQYRHKLLPTLRFDFGFERDNKLYLIEFDGEQHHEYKHCFHKSVSDFEKSRQRDLMKNYVVNNSAIVS